jgi:hypothetical protein
MYIRRPPLNTTKVATITLSALIIIALATGTSHAITGNYQPDPTRTYVGIVVFYDVDADGNKIPISASTGTLISPTVMLTAAHSCVTESAIVCFDEGPLSLSVKDGEIQLEGVTATFEGTAYPNPDYTTNVQGNGLPSSNYPDVAIIILKEPVPTNVVPVYAQLPSQSLVDTLPVTTAVTLSGYGHQYQLKPKNAGPQYSWGGIVMRFSASAKLVSNNFAWSSEFIRCSANPGQGKGGIAYGDSGGPVLLGETNIVLALNSYVTNPNCAGQSYHNRIDTPDVLNWIKEEVSMHG